MFTLGTDHLIFDRGGGGGGRIPPKISGKQFELKKNRARINVHYMQKNVAVVKIRKSPCTDTSLEN